MVDILTDYHCRTKHGISKKELVKQHGAPLFLRTTINREIDKWIRETSVLVTANDFGLAQASVKNQLNKPEHKR